MSGAASSQIEAARVTLVLGACFVDSMSMVNAVTSILVDVFCLGLKRWLWDGQTTGLAIAE